MGINAVIAAWYYLAVVKRMFFDEAAPEVESTTVEVPSLLRVAMGAAVLLLLVGGLFPRVISEFAEKTFL